MCRIRSSPSAPIGSWPMHEVTKAAGTPRMRRTVDTPCEATARPARSSAVAGGDVAPGVAPLREGPWVQPPGFEPEGVQHEQRVARGDARAARRHDLAARGHAGG